AKLPGGDAVTALAADLRDPQGLAFDADGNLYVADGRAGRVLRFRAPPAPVLEPLPAFTNRSPIAVRGATEAGARLDLFVGSHTTAITGSADGTGKFALTVPLLADAENAIEVTATAQGGNGLASPPAHAGVTHDGVGPATMFLAPPAAAFVRRT